MRSLHHLKIAHVYIANSLFANNLRHCTCNRAGIQTALDMHACISICPGLRSSAPIHFCICKACVRLSSRNPLSIYIWTHGVVKCLLTP